MPRYPQDHLGWEAASSAAVDGAFCNVATSEEHFSGGCNVAASEDLCSGASDASEGSYMYPIEGSECNSEGRNVSTVHTPEGIYKGGLTPTILEVSVVRRDKMSRAM